MKLLEKILQIAAVLVFLSVLAVLMADKITFVTADMGRHLKNGELFFSQQLISHTNLYSYTYPDFPFVEHHWGSGAVFLFSGFKGLSVFFITLSLAAFLLCFDAARRSSHFLFATVASVFTLPLIASRTEIRPEVFSYFLIALFFWLLSTAGLRHIRARWLWVLPVLQIL